MAEIHAQKAGHELISGVVVYSAVVSPAWIDANNHMTSTAYPKAFWAGATPLFRLAGIDLDYMARTGCSVFNRACTIRYDRELLAAAPFEIHTWVVGVDDRSVKLFHEMRHVEGWVAARAEYLYGHVDSRARASADWPETIGRFFAAMARAGAGACPQPLPGVAVRSDSRFALLG